LEKKAEFLPLTIVFVPFLLYNEENHPKGDLKNV
jgi:hypothetical protein